MNETARIQDKWATISTILNWPVVIRSLTSYEWDSKRTGQIGNHQYHSESANHNQTTYPLMNEITRIQDKWITISSMLNQPITIRSLTPYEWNSKRPKQIGNHQQHSESANQNQTTHQLWMRQQGGRRDISSILNQPITIRSLTSYEWERKGPRQISNQQQHSESANHN